MKRFQLIYLVILLKDGACFHITSSETFSTFLEIFKVLEKSFRQPKLKRIHQKEEGFLEFQKIKGFSFEKKQFCINTFCHKLS